MFSCKTKIVSLHIIPFHKSYFNMQKKCHGQVFKQLWNHSFFLNSYQIIHLWCLHVVEACHFTVNWFLILFFLSVELFLTSKMKIQHKSQESNLEQTFSQYIFAFWSWDCPISFKTKQWCVKFFAKDFYGIAQLLAIMPPFFQNSV